MTLPSANLSPRIQVEYGDILFTVLFKWVVEFRLKAPRLFPGVLRVSEEHSKKMTRALLPSRFNTISTASVHHCKIVDELDVTVLPVELDAESSCQVLHGF